MDISDNTVENRPADSAGEGGELKTEWQPIETAPKDGTRVLATAFRYGWEAQGPHMVVCRYIWNDWRITGAIADQSLDECTPTHWMPLPASPALTGSAQ